MARSRGRGRRGRRTGQNVYRPRPDVLNADGEVEPEYEVERVSGIRCTDDNQVSGKSERCSICNNYVYIGWYFTPIIYPDRIPSTLCWLRRA